jgi:hypothetical protein
MLGTIIAIAVALRGVAFRSPLVALTGLAATLVFVDVAHGLFILFFAKGVGQANRGFKSPGYLQDWLPLLLISRVQAVPPGRGRHGLAGSGV